MRGKSLHMERETCTIPVPVPIAVPVPRSMSPLPRPSLLLIPYPLSPVSDGGRPLSSPHISIAATVRQTMKPHLPTLRGSLTPPLSLTLSLSLLSLLSLSLQIMDLWCRRTVVRGATALSSARCPLNSHTPHTMYLTFHTLLCLNKSVCPCACPCACPR